MLFSFAGYPSLKQLYDVFNRDEIGEGSTSDDKGEQLQGWRSW